MWGFGHMGYCHCTRTDTLYYLAKDKMPPVNVCPGVSMKIASQELDSRKNHTILHDELRQILDNYFRSKARVSDIRIHAPTCWEMEVNFRVADSALRVRNLREGDIEKSPVCQR